MKKINLNYVGPMATVVFLAASAAAFAACSSDDSGNNGGGGAGGADASTGGSGGAAGGSGGTSGGSGGSAAGAGGSAAGAGGSAGAAALYTCEPKDINPAGTDTAGTDCCSGMGTCTDPSTLSGDPSAYAFGHDSCSDTLSCAPKPISDFIDGGALPTCKTTIGALELEGRCLPTCFVLGDKNAPNLNVGDCPATFNGEDVLCTPCYNPIDGSATGACARDGDAPVDPAPTPFAPCGVYTVGDGSPGEPQGVCVSTDLITSTGAPVGSIPQDTCADGELCAPTVKVKDINSCFKHCSFTAAGALTGEGVCVAPYLVEAVMAGAADLLESTDCDPGEECAPCINPLDSTDTGACSQ